MNFVKTMAAFFLLTCGLMQAKNDQSIISKEELIVELFDIGSIQFGDFTLKVSNGFISTPIYIDMRRIMSYPVLMKKVVRLIVQVTHHLDYDVVCGVPYAAISYACGLS